MNLFKQIKKISFLELLLISLILSLIIIFSGKNSKREGFIEIKGDFIRKTDADIFDDDYVNIYDNLVYNKAKNNYEVGRIFNSNTPNTQKRILDIGCSTGHHVNLLSKDDNYVIGIDNAPAMIKKAKENYPDLHFEVCDALDSMQFSSDTFTHISCLYFTIYSIQDKKLFLENCYNWLIPGGVLVLHLVDMYKFDPVISIVTPNKAVNERLLESFIQFNELDYKSIFNLNNNIDANTTTLDRPNAGFKEIIKFKNPKNVRVNEHNLYMSSQKSILGLARDMGFILQSQEEMTSVKYNNNFLYTLQKPT